MKWRGLVDRIVANESCNFVTTNRVPRRWLTRWVGRISKSERPWVRGPALALWRAFSDIDLSDAEDTEFRSMHDCFTRKLRPGARPIAPDQNCLVSPCDAIVGACGRIEGITLVQAKGQTYSLPELIGDVDLARSFANGCYATLRLTAGMYHRFHAPDDCTVDRVTYFSGDVWNVNPPALARIPKLFCENERALLRLYLSNGQRIALVPVAAILVASIRLHFLDVLLHLDYRGPHDFRCDARFARGEELGWFEHGSTIIVLAPRSFRLTDGIVTGQRVRMGEPLMRRLEVSGV